MKAIAIDSFGGPETLTLQTLPDPELAPHEVLVRIEFAAVGEWDAFEREGGYAKMLGIQPRFPYVLGSEGAGTIAAVGAEVRNLAPGDRVYAVGFLNPKGGFYAEYAAVDAAFVSPIPSPLTPAQAAAVGGVGLTALRGIEDTLKVRPGESVIVFGASGGVGHVAVQLAKRFDARVLAVASGEDGVELVKRLGADAAVDGRSGDVVAAARAFAPGGVDAALLTSGGPAAELCVGAVREGGRVAWPNGIHPEPAPRSGVQASGFNGEPDPEILRRLNRLITSGRFDLHVSRTFPLTEAGEAQRVLTGHHLGKVLLQVQG